MIIYEWRIDLGAELVDDRVIGFDISVADKDKDGSFSWLAWGPGTQKVDMPDRCGEFMLVRPETEFGEVSGSVAWKDASERDPSCSGPDSVDPLRAALARGDRRSVGGLQGHEPSCWARTRSTPSIRPTSASM